VCCHKMAVRRTDAAYPERTAARQNKKYHDAKRRNPVRVMVKDAERRAKKRGLEFSITEEHVSIPDMCPLLGVPLFAAWGKRVAANSPTLDRIDNSRGYVPGNVWVLSNRANTLKGDATPDELMKLALALQMFTALRKVA
jgi:hypothetical protein